MRLALLVLGGCCSAIEPRVVAPTQIGTGYTSVLVDPTDVDHLLPEEREWVADVETKLRSEIGASAVATGDRPVYIRLTVGSGMVVETAFLDKQRAPLGRITQEAALKAGWICTSQKETALGIAEHFKKYFWRSRPRP